MKAIIIGGGTGGLSAAAALGCLGIRCDIFEQAGELREVGAGEGVVSIFGEAGLNVSVQRYFYGCATSLVGTKQAGP